MENNVTATKPIIGGAISFAPFGTALPESASEALDGAYKRLGYISKDGLTNSDTKEITKVVAWGGDTVAALDGEHSDKFRFQLIEAKNENVLAFVYGEDNVTVTEATQTAGKKVEVSARGFNPDLMSLVVDIILEGGVLKRTVIPKGKISELGDIVYVDNNPVAFDAAIEAFTNGTPETHHDYYEYPLEEA